MLPFLPTEIHVQGYTMGNGQHKYRAVVSSTHVRSVMYTTQPLYTVYTHTITASILLFTTVPGYIRVVRLWHAWLGESSHAQLLEYDTLT